MNSHLKENGHRWLMSLTVITVALYLFRTLGHGVSADALTTNAIVTLFAAGSVFSGAISLLVLGSTKSSDYGQLADLKTPLILGLIGGTLIAGIKLLGLFGLT